jgi:DNA invertase Pin-like site-specific DNA recombinase
MTVKGAPQAIGYVRVSTTGQAVEGVSLDAQREKVKAYCELHGLELVAVHADEGISGRRADNRPGLQRALADVCKRKAVLVVYSLSRLARSTRDCIALSERLEKCGADVASITEKLDTTSSMGRFFFTLMAALGQLERDQVSERTIVAMSHMRRLRRRISRHVPYGYDLGTDGKTLVPNAREAARIGVMRRARAAGKSYASIAESLNSKGVAPKTGKQWYASAVRSVLLKDAVRTS